MEKQKQTEEGLAQLAAEQRFDEFEARFKRLVDNYAAQDEELKKLRAEAQRYTGLIQALEQK